MSATLLCGDVREMLSTLPDASVQCVVTSPPYFGLRDYNVEGQIGMEPTVAEYVAAIVDVFRAVRRVLRDDGTCWLNLGDSYAASTSNNGGYSSKRVHIRNDLKPKDLIGIPWRVAFALQEDGWYLRSDIIWHKPNPMPESVTDRPTKAHEYLFLLTRSARYYYDADAIREPHSREWSAETVGPEYMTLKDGRNDGGKCKGNGHPSGRNKRTVWTVSTQPYRKAHFATFPEKLIEPCILAGTSAEGECSICGCAYVRVTSRATPPRLADSDIDHYGTGDAGVHRKTGREYQDCLDANPKQTVGWFPSCDCEDNVPVPQVVLDPFIGSGTTAVVALRHGRSCIGIDLNPDYIELAQRRIEQDAPLFNRVEVPA